MANWVKTRFENETKSFTAIANKIVSNVSQQEIKRKLVEQMLNDFKKKYNAKNLQELRPNAWRTLEGSESWDADTMMKIEKRLRGNNDLQKVYQAINLIVSNKPIDAPIIMMQNNVGMLICGEHTLMACKLLNIEPKVVMF